MGTIDISKIVADELAAMDAGSLVEAKIREGTRKAILAGIDDALGGYKLRSLVREELTKQLPDIVEGIGLDGYARFLAETIQQLVISEMKEDAKKVLTESVTDVFCRRYDEYSLSALLKDWKDYIDPEDEDERVERNESHDGYTCRIMTRKSISGLYELTDLYLDEYGDHPEGAAKSEFEFVITLDSYVGSGKKENAKIDHIYVYGSDITNNIREVRGRFRSLLANLYINKTPIVFDMEKIDEDDHYYETED